MNRQHIKNVVIAGGGTAGWIAAATLSRQLGPLLNITLVESDTIGTVGVGEATIPTHLAFHRLLGIDEQQFMRATQATFKLGIAFENWARLGDRYIHSFGEIGKPTWMGDFHHIWLQAREKGVAEDLGRYCLELQAAEAGKFVTSSKSDINYAYHLDASLYAQYLRKISEASGVKRIEGKISTVQQNPNSGNIQTLIMESGDRIDGDFFLDCTGFRGLLIEKTLGIGFEDWGHWLPVDRAIAIQTRSDVPVIPYTRSIAREAGWQWRIPLQYRVGNGLVYCSEFQSDDEAHHQLVDKIENEHLTEPRLIKFRTGRRCQVWSKNCLALGLASGFMEPLESTSIHLIQASVIRLVQMFPFSGETSALSKRFNHIAQSEFEGIRDFILLHYKATERDDTPFWRDCRNAEIPDSLAERIALFKENAFVYQGSGDLFRVDSWLQVMMGQRVIPGCHHLIGQLMTRDQLQQITRGISENIAQRVSQLPLHQDFIDRYCASPKFEF